MDSEVGLGEGTSKDVVFPKEVVISKFIDGKTNSIICFDEDRELFLEKSGKAIARWALTGSSNISSSYLYIGMEGIEASDETKKHNAAYKIKESLPDVFLEKVDGFNIKYFFKHGAKDLIVRFNDNPDRIGYAWLPSTESTGDHRDVRNILIVQLRPEGLKTLEKLFSESPTSLYDTLMKSLYPNALKALSKEEIIEAVKKHGPDVIRSAETPELKAEYQRRSDSLDLPFDELISKSVYKRRLPCSEVEWLK